MRIENNTNNQYQQSFQNAIFIDLARVPEKKLPAVVAKFKSELGHGPVSYSFSHNGESFNQDVFIGYNPAIEKIADQFSSHFIEKNNKPIKSILIGTGDDSLLGDKLNSKIEQINNKVLSQVNEIIKSLNIKKPKNIKVLSSKDGDESGTVFHLVTDKNTVKWGLPSHSLQDTFKILPNGNHQNSVVSITPKFLGEIDDFYKQTKGQNFTQYNKHNKTYATFQYHTEEDYRLHHTQFAIDWSAILKNRKV